MEPTSAKTTNALPSISVLSLVYSSISFTTMLRIFTIIKAILNSNDISPLSLSSCLSS